MSWLVHSVLIRPQRPLATCSSVKQLWMRCGLNLSLIKLSVRLSPDFLQPSQHNLTVAFPWLFQASLTQGLHDEDVLNCQIHILSGAITKT